MSDQNTLKIWFTDMWGFEPFQFNTEINYFTHLLRLRYNIIIDKGDPDLLVYSCFGDDHLNYQCKKLFFCGENTSPAPPKRIIRASSEYCDAALTQFPDSDINRYFPLWCLFVNWFGHEMPYSIPSNPTYLCSVESLRCSDNRCKKQKDKFCVFLNNNPVEDRIYLYHKLSIIKKVDSFGKLLNNTGVVLRGSELEKLNLIDGYRLTIAFENSYEYGYNTEKVIHPYSVGSIAIYSGGLDRSVFNSRSLFYLEDYKGIDDMINDIKRHEEEPELYAKKLQEPLFVNNQIPLAFTPVPVLEWIAKKCDLS